GDRGVGQARATGVAATMPLDAKGTHYGSITARPDGSLDTTGVQGVDTDLRVRPFFHDGTTISIREFVVGALNNEMGMQAVDPELYAAAHSGTRITTPAGMVLDGSLDKVRALWPPMPRPIPTATASRTRCPRA